MAAIIIEVLEKAIEVIRPGAISAEVDEACRKFTERKDDTALAPGMTFHCVPTLFDQEYGMCFSESILVAETGCEVFTNFPRQLFEVEV